MITRSVTSSYVEITVTSSGCVGEAPGTPRSTRQRPKLDKIGNPAGRAAESREPRKLPSTMGRGIGSSAEQSFFSDLPIRLV
jgi:hypothetical protein